MGKTTNIPWCDATWNPWIGCHKVSSGCKNCYMFREVKRFGQDPENIRKSVTMFNAPLKWSNEKKRIFVCSWSDFFIEEADQWRDEAWNIIKMTPDNRYIILTKRIENVSSRLPKDWDNGYPNVILMVSTENEEMFYRRVPKLLDIPARARGISAEPLLGNIDMGMFAGYLDWVIAGGESGANGLARKDNLDWYRELRQQCIINNVPFFLKQFWSNDKLLKMPELDGVKWMEFPLIFR